MHLNLKPIEKTLSLAKLNQTVNFEVLQNFQSNLNKLFDRFNENESEEHNKSILSDFLKDTFYKDKFEINTKENIDLAIFNGTSSNDAVAVIIEVKKTSNSNEMITIDKPNKKAFRELVLYFMKEMLKHKNNSITYLIASDLRNWFIFDSKDFINNFYSNTEFRSIFKEWEGDSGFIDSDINNDYRYTKIKEFLDKQNLQFDCCHFNIFDFKNLDLSDVRLVNLAKLLSPQHLLKKRFANDSNSLNNEFYNELLYILGLEETASKKIERKKEKDRTAGSLLENTIAVIKSKNKYGDLKINPDSKDISEKDLFSWSLELCIVWLNRILFLKLLEGQLISYHNNNPDFAFLKREKINDFDELHELFFEVLSEKENERSEDIKAKYPNIPYLNSSLFDKSIIEKQTFTIESLKDRYEMKLFPSTVLKDSAGRKLSGSMKTLEYLFRFLDSYNFASVSNEIVQKDNKQIINAAVLGLIFEKINGYQEGAHFTPSFITMYMSRESIRAAVVEKFNAKMNWNCKDFESLKEEIDFKDKEKREKYNEIVNSLRICDPAVGSGHFLVSALNEIISIKHDLKLLNYLDGSRIRDYSLYIENDELIVIEDETDEIFSYRLNENGKPINKLQQVQMALFHEKVTIIENCLFGADINQKSVMICQLRLWIELLKNAYYKEPDYSELETLPNIDINIKCGNSLISRFDLNDKSSKTKADAKIIPLYKEAVSKYKNVTDTRSKNKVKIELENYKNQLKGLMLSRTPKEQQLIDNRDKLRELTSQNEIFKAHNSKEVEKEYAKKVEFLTTQINNLEKEIEDLKSNPIYKNAIEWRYEFPEVLDDDGNYIGFDVVIGNPPYGISLSNEYKKYFQNSYESAQTREIEENGQSIKLKGSLDTFSLFIEKGFRLLQINAQLTFIVPLAITSSDSMTSLHNILLNNCETIYVSTYSNRPNKIFPHADQRVAIIAFAKNMKKTTRLFTTKVNKRYTETPPEEVIKKLEFVNSIDFIKNGRFPKVGTEIELSILNKLFNIKTNLKDLIVKKGEPIYYRTSGGRYYNIVTNFATGSTQEVPFFTSKEYQNILGALLSSNLYYWFLHIYSDNLHIKLFELELLPIPIKELIHKKSEIENIYKDYLIDLQKNSKIKQVNYSHVSEYREYYARKSKHLIDKIDLAIQEAYGLNDDEINFLINYDLKFRTDGE